MLLVNYVYNNSDSFKKNDQWAFWSVAHGPYQNESLNKHTGTKLHSTRNEMLNEVGQQQYYSLLEYRIYKKM